MSERLESVPPTTGLPMQPAAELPRIAAGLGPYGAWDHIDVTGIRAEGRHGVYPAEKTDAQPFVVDLRIFVGTGDAAATDSLTDALDYTVVGSVAAGVVRERSFDLVEKLAHTIAAEVLQLGGPQVAVRVTVHKPQAAPAALAAGVSVTVNRHRALGGGTP